jgi:hypothetical protein
MAVRNDFTAGEVLAAADLNDTFGSRVPFAYGTATPTTTVSGFLWYDTNTTPPTAKVWNGSAFVNVAPAGGLVHINTTTLSGSAVSINNVFSATYDNYRIIITATTSNAVGVFFRYRVSGTDATGSDYTRQTLAGAGSSASAVTSTLSFVLLTGTGATGLHWGNVEILGPFAAAPTLSVSMGNNVAPATEITSTRHTLSTSYDGITIYPDSGTFTGTVRIYGYKNS